MIKIPYITAAYSADLEPAMQLWVLRILVSMGWHREFIQRNGFYNDNLAHALGLGHWVDPDAEEFDAKAVLRDLRQLHRKAEANATKNQLPASLLRNVAKLAALLSLNATDCRILEFAVSVHSGDLLEAAADLVSALSSPKVFQALSAILNVPEADIRASLGVNGALAHSGLVSIDTSAHVLSRKLKVLSDSFADLMVSSEAEPIHLLRGTVSALGPAQLQLGDYRHIQASLDVLCRYLRQANATGRKGVNILLYGAPGTGKSQLARVLAGELGRELFEISSEDASGDAVDGSSRLRAFRAAQSFFARGQALIVFDEIEDVFNDGSSLLGRKSTAQSRKAWMNRALEENPVPTLWLSNSVSGLDPAFIRRFDMVLELPIPPKKQREKILHEHCHDLLDASQLARVAELQTLAPAVAARASSVLRSIRHELDAPTSAAAFERLINSTLGAQGHRPLAKNDPNRLPEVYDPKFIHADADLGAVAAGLVAARTGRLCLYGAPGTGKTAYARWLAEKMEVPLLCKRASDLMSMWLGGSEKNIANAFAQAEQDGALLLIDEVDSFLQDRRGAQHSWEVTGVNEMLTQMESFGGVFIASTNLMTGLDQAALRRFDLKVRLDFLRPEQAWELTRRYCEQLGLPLPQADLQSRLLRLQRLTPGDFAAVRRQHRFHPMVSADALVTALEAECSLKEGGRAALGFV